LNPQDVHRQTACMRYMSSPHRSQRTLSSWEITGVAEPSAEGILRGTRGRGPGVSGMPAIISVHAPCKVAENCVVN
jgi:hypothetical protein